VTACDTGGLARASRRDSARLGGTGRGWRFRQTSPATAPVVVLAAPTRGSHLAPAQVSPLWWAMGHPYPNPRAKRSMDIDRYALVSLYFGASYFSTQQAIALDALGGRPSAGPLAGTGARRSSRCGAGPVSDRECRALVCRRAAEKVGSSEPIAAVAAAATPSAQTVTTSVLMRSAEDTSCLQVRRSTRMMCQSS
jgi:hypothetical protein